MAAGFTTREEIEGTRSPSSCIELLLYLTAVTISVYPSCNGTSWSICVKLFIDTFVLKCL